MKFVLASYGTRGDIEPCVAVGRELLSRGHDVQMAVPPDLIAFVEAAGPTAVAYGPDLQAVLDAHRDFWTHFFRNFWKVRELIRMRREVVEPFLQCWKDIVATLTSLAQGADVLFTGVNFEDAAGNVAEYYDIPLATLHFFPLRANGRFLPFLPAPLGRLTMRLGEWLAWQNAKKVEGVQRGELALPRATAPSPWRITARGSLEIQAYDRVCFPGLAEEWAEHEGRRPFVGALTMDLPTDFDDEVASWVATGTPPIFFGFGSLPVESAAQTLAMISSACEELGERALVCSAGSDFSQVLSAENIKVVDAMNYSAVFPVCRAVVHHGGTGTTAAGLRAGVPTLILSTDLDQTLWGTRVKRLKVGTARRFSTTTAKTLVTDLRTILEPHCVDRAREVATRMTRPAESVMAAADFVEGLARSSRR
ncbi:MULTISPECIES: glycosyltransferase [Mycobacteroides]|jgi:UDP:flavonoid glycosyltransferase YjiC (YdhE family)|uniref:Glycosyl transferase family 1 n=1 Tax=Mycobacteroides chelonae TaxID=1774 RepID=A0AB73LGG9_MYCCH|nr:MULTISPECIES: glycosyltransferase [Mycobacteroides]KRQ29104.1 glycosyl transferase family 1 [Mycobacteroides sp. H072]KRQ38433.1 glycosyl transferase family 1 [Mycobacteroides sp. H002]KRQ52142.1 glycosyl transferase family 1 [Mycobacteroides sp. H054]KRQ71413.1 glycosyl transferase family 1 [Mycobacteroides sp. H001]MBF9318237.1 glycosyltransferase [Mycobacteroides chelonae]